MPGSLKSAKPLRIRGVAYVTRSSGGLERALAVSCAGPQLALFRHFLPEGLSQPLNFADLIRVSHE